MIDFLLPLLGLLVLLALSGFFSGTETALFSLGKIHARRLAEQSPALGAIVNELLGMPQRLLSTILLGNTIVNTTATALMYWLLYARWPNEAATLATVLIMVPLLVAVGELTPKLVAVFNPVRALKLNARAIYFLTRAVGPLLRTSHVLSLRLLHMLVPATMRPTTGLSEEEVGTLLEVGLQEGVLRETEKSMIQEILRLRKRTARDLLTPRVDMVCVAATMPKAGLIKFLKQQAHRRVPVYDETPDTIVGILDVRRFLLAPDQEVVEVMDPPSFVPESMSAARLLKAFQTHKRPMAVVVDEFGGTEGLLTMGDILEEIVGDLADEFREQDQEIQQLGDNVWRVRGTTRLDDLNDDLNLQLPTPPGVETIGGLVAARLGSIPRAGVQVRIGDAQIAVQSVAKNRITELRLERVKEAA